MSDPSTAERVGRYQLLEPIGGGPNGAVSRAKVFGVAGFERQFAVKRFLAELTTTPAMAQALSSAARQYGGLEHPRIARMAEFGVAKGQTFTAVELVVGLDAMRLMAEARLAGETLAAGGGLALISQAARAVGYAHGRGLSHLGLAPTNLIVTADGDVKVTDFGILAATMPPRPVEVPRLANRIAYLAPEQLTGEATSAATDVFVLGVIAYELVSGARAFRGDTPAAIARAIQSGPPPDPPLPRPIVRVLQRCLARSPFERFPDARALADALDAALRVAPVPGTRKDIGAQTKATLDRLAALNEGAMSGVVALNLGTGPVRAPDPPPVPMLGRDSQDVIPTVVEGMGRQKPPESPATTMPDLPRPISTVPGLAPPPIPVPRGISQPSVPASPPPAGAPSTMIGMSAPKRPPSVIPSVPPSIPPIRPRNGPRPGSDLAVPIASPPTIAPEVMPDPHEEPTRVGQEVPKLASALRQQVANEDLNVSIERELDPELAPDPDIESVTMPIAPVVLEPLIGEIGDARDREATRDGRNETEAGREATRDGRDATESERATTTAIDGARGPTVPERNLTMRDPSQAFPDLPERVSTFPGVQPAKPTPRPGAMVMPEREPSASAIMRAQSEAEQRLADAWAGSSPDASEDNGERLPGEAFAAAVAQREGVSSSGPMPMAPAMPPGMPPMGMPPMGMGPPSQSQPLPLGQRPPFESKVPTEAVRKTPGSRRGLWIVVGFVVAIGVGIGGWQVYEQMNADESAKPDKVAHVAYPKGSDHAADPKGSDHVGSSGSGSTGSGSTGSGSTGSGSDAIKVAVADDAGVKVATADDAAVKVAVADAGAVKIAADAATAQPAGSSDSLQIASTPPGARVFIDGADQGITPVKLPGSADRHTVALLLAGTELYVAEVDGHGVFTIALKQVTPPSGPAGIKVIKCKDKDRYYVFVDGKPTGMTCPTERIGTEVGPHTVEVYDVQTETRPKWDINVADTRLSVRVRVE